MPRAWPRGGVVTHRSAKPGTPVQFRPWPPISYRSAKPRRGPRVLLEELEIVRRKHRLGIERDRGKLGDQPQAGRIRAVRNGNGAQVVGEHGDMLGRLPEGRLFAASPPLPELVPAPVLGGIEHDAADDLVVEADKAVERGKIKGDVAGAAEGCNARGKRLGGDRKPARRVVVIVVEADDDVAFGELVQFIALDADVDARGRVKVADAIVADENAGIALRAV